MSEPRSILLVEDDSSIQLLTARLLKRDGYTVEIVSNGRVAMDRISKKAYDVIVLDLMLPAVSGFEILRWLHQTNPDLPKRSVIVFTAASERDVKEVTDVFALIRKPFDMNDFLTTVRRCIANQPT